MTLKEYQKAAANMSDAELKKFIDKMPRADKVAILRPIYMKAPKAELVDKILSRLIA